jgi:hypothetical protein
MWSYVLSGPGNWGALLSETSPKPRLFHQEGFIFKKKGNTTAERMLTQVNCKVM